ncbi:MAG: LpqB family beta-propeller domain-containing protein [Bifidobacteriaceae bacterium]|jgi:spore germination protein GerM|nr:LpqB family beta-propeller domain-containing protein [Bifidobacteriaceae bacterium]
MTQNGKPAPKPAASSAAKPTPQPTPQPAPRPAPRPAAKLVAAMASLCALGALGGIGGCAELPRSGPVQQGSRAEGREEPYVQAVAAPPAPDANLDQIVQGFLQAMLAGNSDDFKVARSYLTEEAAAVWNPLAQVTIYQSGEAPGVAEAGTQLGRVALTVTQVAVVDGSGRYAALEPTPWTQTLALSQDPESQWRISELADGIVIPEDVFRGDYVATKVYFPSADGQFLVPDQRLFARANAATAAVKEFLAGAPPYLTGAVGAVVPSGTRLLSDTVKVTDSVAVVNLSAAISRASETARATVLACLRASLTALPNVNDVVLQSESVPLEVRQAPSLEVDPKAGADLFYLGDAGVWRITDDLPAVIADTEAAVAWESLTVDHSGARMAGLEAGQIKLLDPAKSELRELALPDAAGPVTVPPAFDRLGWVWAALDGAVAAFSAEGEPVKLGATWLDGRRVVALAPARDGARLALAVEAETGVELLVSGIVRGEGAVPWRLTGPLAAGSVATAVSGLAWADDVSLAFLAAPGGAEGPAPAVFTVGGDLTFLKSPTDPPTALTAGRGRTEIYVAGRSGGLFSYLPQGRIWAPLASGARCVTLAP